VIRDPVPGKATGADLVAPVTAFHHQMTLDDYSLESMAKCRKMMDVFRRWGPFFPDSLFMLDFLFAVM
jgi:hypothetical protein